MVDIFDSLYLIIYELLNSGEIISSEYVDTASAQFWILGLAIFFTCLLVWIPIRCCFRLVKWGLGD